MGMIGQLHVPAASHPKKEPALPVGKVGICFYVGSGIRCEDKKSLVFHHVATYCIDWSIAAELYSLF